MARGELMKKLLANYGQDTEFRAVAESSGFGARVDRGQTVDARLRGAVVEYDENRAGAELTYSHFKPFDIVIGGGYSFGRSFNFHRANEKFDFDGAPYIKLGVAAHF